jgi:hypothetical protein
VKLGSLKASPSLRFASGTFSGIHCGTGMGKVRSTTWRSLPIMPRWRGRLGLGKSRMVTGGDQAKSSRAELRVDHQEMASVINKDFVVEAIFLFADTTRSADACPNLLHHAPFSLSPSLLWFFRLKPTLD